MSPKGGTDYGRDLDGFATRRFNRPFGTALTGCSFPALKRRAILCLSLRDDMSVEFPKRIKVRVYRPVSHGAWPQPGVRRSDRCWPATCRAPAGCRESAVCSHQWCVESSPVPLSPLQCGHELTLPSSRRTVEQNVPLCKFAFARFPLRRAALQPASTPRRPRDFRDTFCLRTPTRSSRPRTIRAWWRWSRALWRNPAPMMF